MYTIAPTDYNWFSFLKETYTTGIVNFWTPTPWKIKNVELGSKWFFKKKGGEKLICGYGIYNGIQIMTVKNAWTKFGTNNGCSSYAQFNSELSKYNDTIEGEKEIGAILLSDVVFFDEKDFINLDNRRIEWSNNIVKYKTYNDSDIMLSTSIEQKTNFKLVETLNKRRKDSNINLREGQSEFRQKISKAYHYKCCVTGESCPDLLEAAHIQSYISKDSNHIQNGLLLRVDIHKMFDSGLIAINKDYEIIISSEITTDYYHNLAGRKITLPDDIADYPSKEALVLKMNELR